MVEIPVNDLEQKPLLLLRPVVSRGGPGWSLMSPGGLLFLWTMPTQRPGVTQVLSSQLESSQGFGAGLSEKLSTGY